MRMLGAVMVIVGTTSWGVWFAFQNKKKLNNIRELIFFSERLLTEMSYSLKPLPEAMSEAAVGIKGPLRMVIKAVVAKILSGEGTSAHEAWWREFSSARDDLMFNGEEMDIVLHWGAGLGCSGLDDQVRILELAVERLKKREHILQSEMAKKNKLLYYLGFVVGALLVLVFY